MVACPPFHGMPWLTCS